MRRLAPIFASVFSLATVALLAIGGWLVVSGSAGHPPAAIAGPPSRLLGGQVDLGKGTASAYAEMNEQGEPTAIGILFSPAALEGLPDGSDFHHCFDRNQDGRIDRATECLHGYEHVLPLPDALARRPDIPFKWVLLNWNPAGHVPPGVYDVPHFDVHFFMEPIASVFALASGPCGPEFIRCDQFEIARQPVPSNYVHPDYKDVGAAVPAMGNHLIDLGGPEFHGQPFTRSFIFGSYGGRITFYEEMVSHRTLVANPRSCAPIKTPKAVATAGFYPTISCLWHHAPGGEITVSLERFAFRLATPPAAAAAAAAPPAGPGTPVTPVHTH
jgi:hypothetical protein